MARFCTQCGKKLEEGEICSCQTQNTFVAQATEEMKQTNQQGADGQQRQQQYQQQYQEVQKAVSSHATASLGTLLNLVQHPITAGRTFVNVGERSIVITLIILQGIMSGLFAVMAASKVGKYVEAIGNTALSYVMDSSTNLIKMPYARIFLVTLIISCILSVVLAGLLFGGNKVLKNEVNIQQMLAVVSVRSALLIVTSLIAIIVFILQPVLGLIIFYAGSLWGVIVMARIIPISVSEMEDRLSLMIFLASVIFIAITIFVMYKCWPVFVPDTIKEAYKAMGSYISNPLDLLEELY